MLLFSPELSPCNKAHRPQQILVRLLLFVAEAGIAVITRQKQPRQKQPR